MSRSTSAGESACANMPRMCFLARSSVSCRYAVTATKLAPIAATGATRPSHQLHIPNTTKHPTATSAAAKASAAGAACVITGRVAETSVTSARQQDHQEVQPPRGLAHELAGQDRIDDVRVDLHPRHARPHRRGHEVRRPGRG